MSHLGAKKTISFRAYMGHERRGLRKEAKNLSSLSCIITRAYGLCVIK